MTGPSVLLAIGNHDLRRQLRFLLLRQGIEVMEASSNHAIPECVETNSPSLLILGAPQPNGTDALEIAEQIRKRDRRFPIILVTAEGSEALAVAALRAGLKDYFREPFAPEGCHID